MAAVLSHLSKPLGVVASGSTFSFLLAATWTSFRAYSSTSTASTSETTLGNCPFHDFQGQVAVCDRSAPSDVERIAQDMQSSGTVGLSFTVSSSGRMKAVKVASESSAILWAVPYGKPSMPNVLRALLEDKNLLKTVFNCNEEIQTLKKVYNVDLTHFVDVALSSWRAGLQKDPQEHRLVDDLARRCCHVVVDRGEKEGRPLTLYARGRLSSLRGVASDAWATLVLHRRIEKLADMSPAASSPSWRTAAGNDTLFHGACLSADDQARALHDAAVDNSTTG